MIRNIMLTVDLTATGGHGASQIKKRKSCVSDSLFYLALFDVIFFVTSSLISWQKFWWFASVNFLVILRLNNCEIFTPSSSYCRNHAVKSSKTPSISWWYCKWKTEDKSYCFSKLQFKESLSPLHRQKLRFPSAEVSNGGLFFRLSNYINSAGEGQGTNTFVILALVIF